MTRTFQPGEQKVRPGTYFRISNIGDPPFLAGAVGIAATIVQSNWGPLGEVIDLEGSNEITSKIGLTGVNVLSEVFRGGAREIKAIRVGSGGTRAELVLKDGNEEDVIRLSTKYPTSRQFRLIIRDVLGDADKRECLVYEEMQERERLVFTTDNQIEAFVDVINKESVFFDAEKMSDGDGTLESIFNSLVDGGADPQVTGEDYVIAEEILETVDWNILITDSADASIHATIHSYIDRLRNEGKRVMAVVGEPTEISLSQRLTNSASYNFPGVLYVANGFETARGPVEGVNAAARVAGMILGSNYNSSITHAIVTGAADLIGPLTNQQIIDAINAGAIVFSRNALGQIQVEYGITTFISPNDELDAGWSKIRRVRTRDTLIERVLRSTDPLVGQINNDDDGRATIVSIVNGIIQQMTNENGLLGGECYVDPSQQPVGDSSWFVIEVDDVDSMEKVYFTFGFRYSPATN
ncbi:phage tail sheath subtilisin-like domain-containing protein [Halalkalibacter sp. AB-rgal2]|uniref:phage tail sheath subtilisin-like domain-containing protein n=1 Tax=Halalkalibacter sp. AB-rgal2 TaxID=3242695 RepID=UPI00359D9FBC